MRETNDQLINAILENEWGKASNIVECQPHLVKKPFSTQSFLGGHSSSEVLPLHLAVSRFKVPLRFIQLLINHYPQSIEESEYALERLPLHIALKKNTQNDELITYLLTQWPSAVSCKDGMGRVPIHYACSNHASVRILRALINASPHSIYAVDNFGWTPLHVAASIHTSVDVINFLLEAGPSVVLSKTLKGSTPEMCALESDALNKNEILRTLGEARRVYVETDPLYKRLKEGKRPESSIKARSGSSTSRRPGSSTSRRPGSSATRPGSSSSRSRPSSSATKAGSSVTRPGSSIKKFRGIRKQLNEDDIVEVV